MLNVYCWRCGTQINKNNILGLGHFDHQIGKYQGKAFIAFKCPKCQKVRYQIMNTDLLSIQKNSFNKQKNGHDNHKILEFGEKIDIDQVIDFFEMLSDIDTVEGFLEQCRISKDDKSILLNKPIVQPLNVYNLFKDLNSANMKRLMILTLDEENYVIDWEFLGENTSNPINFDPKIIFHTPFNFENEVSIIIAENLKDQFNQPTQKEILKTKRLVKTGEILGIRFLDRIVIEQNGFHSYDQLDLI